MTSEDELLLLLSRGALSPFVQEQACALLSTSLNWDVILERVTAEEVYPLFYRNLQALETASRREQGAGSGEQGAKSKELSGKSKDLGAGSKEQGAKSERNQRSSRNGINVKNTSGEEGKEQQPPAPCSKLHAPCNAMAGSLREVLGRLGGLAKINAFRNALLTEELVRVLKLLADAGIPTIPLKGVTLADSLYGDPAMRVCVDLDILVPRSMVGRAFDLLCAEGYVSEFGPGFFANLLLRHDIEYALRRQERGFEFMVELHWGVLWGGKLEESVTDQLWADAYSTTVFGAPAYALSPEWQILFLAAHAARHQWQGLKWLVDLHELFSSTEIDWDKLNKKAKQLGWEEVLRISLHACHALFDTPVPAKFSLGDLPPWVKLFPASAPANLSGAFFATRFLKSTSDKLGYTARVLFIPTLAEWRFVQMPSFLSFLYYPLRPLRLLCKWGGAWLAGSLGQSAKG